MKKLVAYCCTKNPAHRVLVCDDLGLGRVKIYCHCGDPRVQTDLNDAVIRQLLTQTRTEERDRIRALVETTETPQKSSEFISGFNHCIDTVLDYLNT